MTTHTLPNAGKGSATLRNLDLGLPTWEEVKRMMKTTAVMVTLIVCGTVLGLALLSVIGILLYYGKDTAALLTLVNVFITGAGLAKTYSVDRRTTRIEQQTNGTQTRLMDHALGPQPIRPE